MRSSRSAPTATTPPKHQPAALRRANSNFPEGDVYLGTVDAGVDRYAFKTTRPVFNELFTTLRLRQRGRRKRMPAYRCRVRRRPVSAASIVVEDGRTCIGLEMCWRHTAA